MTQTRLSSFYEVCISTFIGFGLSLVLQTILSQVYHLNTSTSANVQITLWFTILSIVRGYVIRRWFNARLKRLAERMAK